MKKFLKKYNNSININLLIQDIGETRNNYETITIKILKYFYNINESKEDENEDDENSGENISDNTNNNDDLSENWWNDSKEEDVVMEQFMKKNDNKNSSFNIDYEEVPKKRTYNYIKDNIIKNLYNLDNNDLPKIKPMLKLK